MHQLFQISRLVGMMCGFASLFFVQGVVGSGSISKKNMWIFFEKTWWCFAVSPIFLVRSQKGPF